MCTMSLGPRSHPHGPKTPNLPSGFMTLRLTYQNPTKILPKSYPSSPSAWYQAGHPSKKVGKKKRFPNLPSAHLTMCSIPLRPRSYPHCPRTPTLPRVSMPQRVDYQNLTKLLPKSYPGQGTKTGLQHGDASNCGVIEAP